MTDAWQADISTRIALLEKESKHRRELTDTRFDAAAKALEVALEANNKRLDSMNEFRNSLNDVSTRMINRSEAEQTIEAVRSKLTADIRVINDKIDTYGKPNYIMGITAIAAILTSIGGLWTVTGLKIDNAISPLAVQQENLRASQISQDRDLIRLNDQIRDLYRVTSQLQVMEAKQEVEIDERLKRWREWSRAP